MNNVGSSRTLKKFIQETVRSRSKRAACCLIVADDGKVLAVSRRDDPTMFGLPGGKVDNGEDDATAAARELWEETGLQAHQMAPVYSALDKQGYQTTTFACFPEGEIDTEEEGIVAWVEPEVLLDHGQCPFVDYNRKLFHALGWFDDEHDGVNSQHMP